MQERSRLLEREIETLKAKLASQAGNDLLSQIMQINGQQVLVAQLEGVDAKSLRTTMDDLKNRLLLLKSIKQGPRGPCLLLWSTVPSPSPQPQTWW